MTKVLALDLGADTGVCVMVEGGAFAVYTIKNPCSKWMVHSLDNLARKINTILTTDKPDLVVIEGYAFGAKFGREVSGERCGVVQLLCHRVGLLPVFVAPPSLKKYTCGPLEKGRDGKQEVIKRVERDYPGRCQHDHESDALMLAHIGWHIQNDIEPEFAYRREVLKNIKVEQIAAATENYNASIALIKRNERELNQQLKGKK